MLVMSSSGSSIVLDPSIRDWVLIPITLVMFLQGVLRQYVAGALREQGPKVDTDMAAKNQLLRRSQRLRANGHYLLPQAFQMRKRFFVDRAFKEKPKVEGEEPAVPAQDPFVMMNMMKQNMAMIVPNMLLMGWVSYFFPGFVMAKLPFGLTDRFKQMLQRGIFLSSLNVSYITSLSWYVINLFGMRGLFSLVLGSGNAALDDPNAMASQMQMQAGMGQQPDINKLYNQEKTELEIVQHDFAIRHSEERLLARIQSNKKRLH